MNHINPTHFERIPPLVDGEQGLVNAVIETPRDTRLKFAFEHEFGFWQRPEEQRASNSRVSKIGPAGCRRARDGRLLPAFRFIGLARRVLRFSSAIRM
jgi:hypothetical protein